jgi:hypothetical protein
LAAVTQGAGAAHDFDAAGGNRIDRHAVVGAISDASELLVPFSNMRTRLASMPRIMGRLAPAAKPELETPGTFARESARLEPPCWRI